MRNPKVELFRLNFDTHSTVYCLLSNNPAAAFNLIYLSICDIFFLIQKKKCSLRVINWRGKAD